MTEYKILSFKDAAAMDAPLPPYEDSWEDALQWDENGHGIWRFEDGVPVACVGTDGGEPEDQTLYRDWRWVAGALQDAYELGRVSA